MIEFFFAESLNDGFFELNGVDYPKGQYGLKYDGNLADETQAGRNFSLFDVNTRRYLIEIKSRHYSEVDGVNSWDELLQLLRGLCVLEAGIASGVALDVNIQDQYTPLIIASFSKEEASTTLAAVAAIDAYQITVDDASGFIEGHYMSIFSVDDNRFYLGEVLTVAGNVLTLDTPLDFAFPVGSFVTSGNRNMNVDGSGTPVVFGVRNTDEQIGSAFDITRIILHCETDNSIDLSKFGDINGGLLRGIVMRKVDGVQRNVFNAKTNGELKSLMYDFDVEASSNPNQGQDGFTGRMTFGGQSKMGVVIRLNRGEDLQLLVQDDLTDLQIFEIVCEGHTVE